jgi:GNAT superfamily N-acetyltransferase
MTTEGVLRTVDPAPHHRNDWRRLFQGYADFYKTTIDDRVKDTVWGWLNDPGHVMEGLFVERQDAGGVWRLVGIAHVRAMPRPLGGTEVGFLDDLFVDPALRGGGVVDALFDAIRERARARGWPLVRWLTQEFNYRARSVYDRVGYKTPFILYAMDTK